MIDWLDFIAPLAHCAELGGPFWNGEVMATKPDPTHPDGCVLDWGVLKGKPFEGSHSSRIIIKSTATADGLPAIRVSGNPAKWFQGHNVFGSEDLKGLAIEMLDRICASVGLKPRWTDRRHWLEGNIQLLRTDLTYSLDFGNQRRVHEAMQSLDKTARLRHRGRGSYNSDKATLLYGRGSRRWSLNLYAKGTEIATKGHQLPLPLQATQLPEAADGLLRMEVRMLSMELQQRKLSMVHQWDTCNMQLLHAEFIDKLEIASTTMIQAKSLDTLPPSQRICYDAWKSGSDMKAILSNTTFYRYRIALLKHGVDIGIKQSGTPVDNVVPMRVTLVGKPFVVPEWAKGTPLYFEPQKRA